MNKKAARQRRRRKRQQPPPPPEQLEADDPETLEYRSEWLSTPKAAKAAGISYWSLYRLIRQGSYNPPYYFPRFGYRIPQCDVPLIKRIYWQARESVNWGPIPGRPQGQRSKVRYRHGEPDTGEDDRDLDDKDTDE